MQQNTNRYYIGIDVSKSWFDLSLLTVTGTGKQPVVSERFDNDEQGIKKLDKWLRSKGVTFDHGSLVVIENTGLYHRLLWSYCNAHQLPLHIGNAAHIKWSMGIVRGKSDITDSQRLCSYACKNADELKAAPVADEQLLLLKDLMTGRDQLLSQKSAIEVRLGELKEKIAAAVYRQMAKAHQAALKGLEKSIGQIDEQITKLVKENSAVKVNYDLLLSVPGIGHYTAVYLICCTWNFAGGSISGKQLACYAGVAPFTDSSGSSIKGRNKVHKMGNKELKKRLHMCALATLSHYPEFKDYYDRKKLQGKHPNSILNAIKGKLLLRVASVINKQEKYVDNYSKAA